MTICDEIREERSRQDAKWGGPKHDDEHTPGEWLEYILEHLAKGFTDNRTAQDRARIAFVSAIAPHVRLSADSETKRSQFVRVAALAVAAVESMERRAV